MLHMLCTVAPDSAHATCWCLVSINSQKTPLGEHKGCMKVSMSRVLPSCQRLLVWTDRDSTGKMKATPWTHRRGAVVRRPSQTRPNWKLILGFIEGPLEAFPKNSQTPYGPMLTCLLAPESPVTGLALGGFGGSPHKRL